MPNLNVKSLYNSRGFTLVEIAIALSIIALLFSIAAFKIQEYKKGAYDTEAKTILNTLTTQVNTKTEDCMREIRNPPYPQECSTIGPIFIAENEHGQTAIAKIAGLTTKDFPTCSDPKTCSECSASGCCLENNVFHFESQSICAANTNGSKIFCQDILSKDITTTDFDEPTELTFGCASAVGVLY